MFAYYSGAWEACQLCELRPSARLVALALADCLNAEGVCWPSQRRLAEMTGLSVRTVGRALNALEGHGVIGRTKRAAEDGSGRTSDLIAWKVPVRAGSRPAHHMAEVDPLPVVTA